MQIIWLPYINKNRPNQDNSVIVTDSMGSLELIDSLDNISSVNYNSNNRIDFSKFRLNRNWNRELFNHFLY
jgi:hypothetical protein